VEVPRGMGDQISLGKESFQKWEVYCYQIHHLHKNQKATSKYETKERYVDEAC